jgi:hypothetical protein
MDRINELIKDKNKSKDQIDDLKLKMNKLEIII